MKTSITVLIPSFGHGLVDVEYKVNGVHDKTLYTFTGFWPLYRGERGDRLDTQAVINMNGQKDIEELIVEKTQGRYRESIEADNANPRITKKFNFKKPTNHIPE